MKYNEYIGQDLKRFKEKAALYIQKQVEPADVNFETEQSTLSFFNTEEFESARQSNNSQSSPNQLGDNHLSVKPFTVTAAYKDLATLVACVSFDDKWNLLYDLLYRIKIHTPHLLELSTDPMVKKAGLYKKAITREIHKVHAFVRFKKSEVDGTEVYVAWFEPTHFVLELAAPFFARRFGDRKWSIFTPYQSAHWDLIELIFLKGITEDEFKHKDSVDILWTSYYRSIYNPARLNMKATKNEMAVKYWKNMPETQIMNELIQQTPERLRQMATKANRKIEIDEAWTIEEVFLKAKACRACPIGENATQTVFGKGPTNATLMIVGEQPGDSEDISGEPFVGPAGTVLDKVLVELNVDRAEIYLTNAVKHFKWEGKYKNTSHNENDQQVTGLRLHKKASTREIAICRPWLDAEIQRVKPKVMIAMGVTAALSIMGRLVKLKTERGKPQWSELYNCWILCTWHPAAILRTQSEEEATERLKQLTIDIQKSVELALAK